MFAGTHAYFTMEENRTCSVNYFCFGALLIFIGSILLCSLGFTIILPFMKTKDWQEVTCTVIASDINKSLCACEEKDNTYPGCGDFSPCLQVYVTYRSNGNLTEEIEHEQILESGINKVTSVSNTTSVAKFHRNLGQHDLSNKTISTKSSFIKDSVSKKEYNEQMGSGEGSLFLTNGSVIRLQENIFYESDEYVQALLYRSWSDIFYTHCSLQECGNQEWNTKEIRRFKAKWGSVGQDFSCFVNPDQSDLVLLTRTSFWSMLHAVLWPSACLFVGITLWLGLCCGCWSLDNENDTSTPYYGVL